MKDIIGVTLNAHDSNWYDGELHYQAERYTRKKRNIYKGDRQEFYLDHVKPRLLDKSIISAITYTAGGIHPLAFPIDDPRLNILKPHWDDILEHDSSFKNLWDYKQLDNIYYLNHHQSHGAYAFIDSGFEESDILAIDGGGAGYCTVFFDKDGNKRNLSDELPLGFMWNISCSVVNMSPREAGKLMGLSGYGQFNQRYWTVLEMFHDHYIEFGKDYPSVDLYKSQLREVKAEDIAYTMQQYTLEKIQELILTLKTSNNICVCGGVSYNGYMNELLTKIYDKVHVPSAPGDEGQSIGNYIHAQYTLNGVKHKPSIYGGQSYEFNDPSFEDLDLTAVAQAIADGAIIGWYQGKSESGNRALGNRSMLADPRNPNIKDIINSTVKMREDYRPFAPSVLEEHYHEYFDTNQPSPHMSRIMPVISDKIPGVTHVDGTARIQTVAKESNLMYYNLINEFYKITGVPMLVNTSFNCQEPIVETPQDAIATFERTALSILVINDKMKCK